MMNIFIGHRIIMIFKNKMIINMDFCIFPFCILITCLVVMVLMLAYQLLQITPVEMFSFFERVD